MDSWVTHKQLMNAIFGQLFIFNKTEVQTFILRCLMSLNLNWHKAVVVGACSLVYRTTYCAFWIFFWQNNNLYILIWEFKGFVQNNFCQFCKSLINIYLHSCRCLQKWYTIFYCKYFTSFLYNNQDYLGLFNHKLHCKCLQTKDRQTNV